MLLLRLFADAKPANDWTMWLLIGGLVVVMVVMFIVPQQRNKKKAKEMMENVKVGRNITTIGGVLGTIIEINDAKNYIVIETGNDDSKSIIKFSKQAIYFVEPEGGAKDAQTSAEQPKAEEEYNEITPNKK